MSRHQSTRRRRRCLLPRRRLRPRRWEKTTGLRRTARHAVSLIRCLRRPCCESSSACRTNRPSFASACAMSGGRWLACCLSGTAGSSAWHASLRRHSLSHAPCRQLLARPQRRSPPSSPPRPRPLGSVRAGFPRTRRAWPRAVLAGPSSPCPRRPMSVAALTNWCLSHSSQRTTFCFRPARRPGVSTRGTRTASCACGVRTRATSSPESRSPEPSHRSRPQVASCS
mmetsp:Transcript_17503/g.57337  ORF Transcript_17503/g.57337 Transcript_17503/m.57337 type:complete len:226 (+) Transcript_17503:190-867(+)